VRVDEPTVPSRMRPFAQFDALRDVASAVAGGADAESVFALVAEHAADLVDADGCALIRFGEGATGRLVGQWAREGMFPNGFSRNVPLTGDSAVARVHRDGTPAVVDSYEDMPDPRGRLLSGEYGSGAAVPVMVGIGAWGALAVGARRRDAFDDRTIGRLTDFARLISLAIPSRDPDSKTGIEALLETLLTSAPVGFAHLSMDGRVLRANQAFAAIGGMQPSQLVNRRVGDVVDRFPMLAMVDLDRVARSERELLDVPSTVDDPWRGTRFVLTSFYPVRRDTLLGVGVLIVDVTAERRAAEDLRRERNYSAALIDALQDGLAVTAPDGTLSDVNERFCDMTGFPRHELIGAKPPYPYWPPERAADLRRSLMRALRGEAEAEHMEYVRADGTGLAVVVARSPLRDAAGRMKGIVATVRDVTGERRAERERAALLEAEQLARRRALILHQIGSSLSRAVTPGQVKEVASSAAAALLGATSCVILDRVDGRIVPTAGLRDVLAADRGASADALARVARSGRASYARDADAVRATFPALAEAGWRAVAALPMGSGQRGRGVLLLGFTTPRPFPPEDRLLYETVSDLALQALERARLYEAERATTEGLRARDASRVALLRGVSHEFRSPLTAIANAAAALEQVTDVDDRRELAAVVRTETGRLDRFVANVLDLSRLEGHILEPRFDWCSVVELVAGALEAVTALAGGLSVTTAVPDDIPLVRADPVLTERILLNLLHNAVRHGGDAIDVTVECDARVVRFAVSDDGRGVAPDAREAIFSPFVGDGDRGGLGLGLALSRGLAEAQGGTLELDARAPGARFVLTLPVDRQAPS